MEQHNLNVFETGGLDEQSKAYLLETTRWTKFLAIMGFIFIGLLIIVALAFLVAGSALSAYSSSGLALLGATGGSIFFLVIIALYVYPVYALWKFSTNMKSGINMANQEQIIEGFRYQKNMYRFMGILMIIVLAFYLLGIISSIF